MDINDLISAAQEGIEKSDLQFDPALQRYFDPELNLYYSPESRDYFDKRNGAYYKRINGELIRTGQDARFKPARPQEDSSSEDEEEQVEEEKGEKGDKEKKKKCDEEEQEKMLEEYKLANPGSFIDFTSLAPPPPPPEDEGKVVEENEEEPVYHGENVRIMVMQSDTVQLGQLHIITEIGGVIGAGYGSNIRIEENGVKTKHVSIQMRTRKNEIGVDENYFEAIYHAFGQYNGKLTPAQAAHRIAHMDRVTVGTTTLILHVHPPGDTCDACQSTTIRSELPETLQMGILTGAEQKEFLDKAEAERIREFYNFDKYCWGPGMCKAAQEQVAKREERAEKKKEQETLEKLNKANEKLLAAGHQPLNLSQTRKRDRSKGFAIGHVDPMDNLGPDAADDWKSRRVVKTHSKRMKRNVLERTELNYEQEEEKLRQKSLNRTWY